MKRIVLFIILMAMLWQASAQRPVIPAGTGEYMCMPPATQDSVSIYPPLPKTCTVVDIGQDSHPETAPGTTGWARQETLMKIPVRELQANQRKIVLQK